MFQNRKSYSNYRLDLICINAISAAFSGASCSAVNISGSPSWLRRACLTLAQWFMQSFSFPQDCLHYSSYYADDNALDKWVVRKVKERFLQQRLYWFTMIGFSLKTYSHSRCVKVEEPNSPEQIRSATILGTIWCRWNYVHRVPPSPSASLL